MPWTEWLIKLQTSTPGHSSLSMKMYFSFSALCHTGGVTVPRHHYITFLHNSLCTDTFTLNNTSSFWGCSAYFTACQSGCVVVQHVWVFLPVNRAPLCILQQSGKCYVWKYSSKYSFSFSEVTGSFRVIKYTLCAKNTFFLMGIICMCWWWYRVMDFKMAAVPGPTLRTTSLLITVTVVEVVAQKRHNVKTLHSFTQSKWTTNARLLCFSASARFWKSYKPVRHTT